MKTSSQRSVKFLAGALAGLSLGVPAGLAQTPRAHPAATVMVQANGSYLGIGVEDIDTDRAKTLNLKEERGALVSSVMEDGPAAKAGLHEKDVILEFNGQPVQSMQQLQRMVRETPPGRQVKLGIWRGGAPQTLTATMESAKNTVFDGNGFGSFNVAMPPMPPMPPVRIDIPRFQAVMQSWTLGVETEALGDEPQFAEFLGVKEGVLIKAVMKDSPAEKAGLKAGDVLVKIEDSKVRNTEDVTGALRTVRGKSSYNVTVVRSKKEMVVPVNLERRGELNLGAGPAIFV
jgi:serine protease Do